ncbi:MAG: hypothetical protein ACPHK8_02610, partial [Thermoplasmatota archaeon]
GFDFPHMVMDGAIVIEGLPPGAPYLATNDAYRNAFEERASLESPVRMEVHSNGTHLIANLTPSIPLGDSIRAWGALAEDNVFYDAGRLGNGVTNHRMTVRTTVDLGLVDLTTTQVVSMPLPVLEDPTQWYGVIWLQQEPVDGAQFDAHEVVQSTTHPLRQTEPTVQDEKGVLMQMYSATWCDTCLFGDLVAEEMLADYGPSTKELAPSSYLANVPWLPLLLVAAAGALFVYFWPMRRAP